jgi:protein-S-isoprenylcysteine O-methyltransferase Ste14
MTARDWLRNARGEWYVLGQGVLIGAVLLAPNVEARGYVWSGLSSALGAVLGVVGLCGVALGAIGLGRENLTPFPKPRDDGTLVEDGVFSVVRHPIYSGFGLAAFGWSLMWSSIAAFAAALVLLVFFDIKARREERWLSQKFPGYRAYQSRVKRLIPFVY